MEPLERLSTEQINMNSLNLDVMSSLEIVDCMNLEDRKVAAAVGHCLPDIARAVDLITEAMKNGGRLFYMGAGTSGWLGKLDASEYSPTFGVSSDLVQGIMAGESAEEGVSFEEAEDDAVLGAQDLRKRGLAEADVVVGISASGRTPYVLGALNCARTVGAGTVSISCNRDSAAGEIADVAIEVVVGPEVLSGSTRLKAGTAQKMVLNMLSTATMVRQGKTYRNLMVNLRPDNEKLRVRAKAIVRQATESEEEAVEYVYERSGRDVGVSIVMLLAQTDAAQAAEYIRLARGRIRDALRLAGVTRGEG